MNHYQLPLEFSPALFHFCEFESYPDKACIFFLEQYLGQHDLGIVLGADGTLQILPHQVRIPDVSFIAWQRFPNRELPAEPIPHLAPDLAVEILSESNTTSEIARKLRDYFASGTALVWIIDPAARTAQVYSSPIQFTTVAEDGQLTGGELLPGFTLTLSSLFTRAGKRSS